jgi:hypothetical protein
MLQGPVDFPSCNSDGSSDISSGAPRCSAAAQVMLTRVQKWSWLKAWAMNIAKRRGQKKAIVSLARRLAVIMHRMWSDGTEFRWTRVMAPTI